MTGEAVRTAATEIFARRGAARPDARIAGVIVQPMIVRPQARELIAGIADDPTFGPVIVFGCGGTAVEVIDDKALALPPLACSPTTAALLRWTLGSPLHRSGQNSAAAGIRDSQCGPIPRNGREGSNSAMAQNCWCVRFGRMTR